MSESQANHLSKREKCKSKKGFTIIEVSIFLAITGLLLVGVLGGTYSNIARQRYNDSVRSFAEYFRQIYAEVISPETFGSGNSNESAIYGKVIVFGLESPDDNENKDQDNTVYSATLVGDVHVPNHSSGFIDELGQVNARLFCGNPNDEDEASSTLSTYTPLWGAKIHNTDEKPFRGTMIISRSPTSGTVHTAFTTEQFNIKEHCAPDDQSASSLFHTAITETPQIFSANPSESVDFCLESENSNIIRDIRLHLGVEGRNTSSVNIVPDDPEESKCQR